MTGRADAIERKVPMRRSISATLGVTLCAIGAAPGVASADLSLTPGVPIATTLPDGSSGAPPAFAGRAARGGVVTANHPQAAEAGARILAKGGNAIDAAVAVAFAMNVVEPFGSGIGGGGVMTVHLAAENRTYFLDYLETAPAAAGPALFGNLSYMDASASGISVGVPGAVRGWEQALKRWGTMTFADVAAPAIDLAENGVRVSAFLASYAGHPLTTLQPETRAIFRRPDGSRLQEGDLLVQADLANTFRRIAAGGADAFYTGPIASAIVAAQLRTFVFGGSTPRGAPGKMELADLAAYRAVLRDPLEFRYRGVTVRSGHAPVHGGALMGQWLGILEGFPIGDAAAGFGFGATRTLHVMIETMRLVYADRVYWVGDPDHAPVPIAGLTSAAYIAERAALVDVATRMATAPHGNPLPYDATPAMGEPAMEGSETAHWSVVDRWGNFVACTGSIEQFWGTGITVPGHGFLLNNVLTDFNMTPQRNDETGNPGINDVAPNKRPRSGMSPTLLLIDGKPFAALGAPGGGRIINSILQVIVNMVDHGMDLQAAIDAPRVSAHSAAGIVEVEPGFAPLVLSELVGLGHPLATPPPERIGAVNAVVVDLLTGKQYGGTDARRGGAVVSLPK